MASSYLTGPTPLGKVQKPPYTVEAPGFQPVEGETIPRRHPKAKDGLVERPAPDVHTTFDLLKRSVALYGNEPAVGSRKLIRTHKETKKVPKVVDGRTTEVDKEWTYYELSDYSYMTYREYFNQVLQVGAGLRKLGLLPGSRLHLFATTTPQWLTMAHACSSQSMAIVTAYDTLGESGVEHSLVQSKANAMFVDPHLLKTIGNPLKKADAVKIVIYNEATHLPVSDVEIEKFKSAHPELTVLSFAELSAVGEENPAEPVPPKPEDMYCIMYTSGSTGPPKGVPVAHTGFVAAVAGLHSVVEDTVSHREFVLAYLPLAHIFELVLENLVIFLGATLGYGSPRTLSDASMRNCHGDMRTFAPTVMVGVPQIWETVKKGIEGKVSSSGLATRALFSAALALKSFLVRNSLPGAGLLDATVFSKVRQMTGGRLRFIVNGASGIATPTLHFMSMAVAPMINGYGLTETCGNGALGCPLQWTPGPAIGPIPAAVEIKLVSLPELNYSASSTPPQGEILIRGAPVLAAYLDNPDETAKAITPDSGGGWFRTGDIGEFDAAGHLAVIDRVKNLVKLQGGEYIALEKLEAIYRGVGYVHNIMVHGDSSCARPVAVVVANEKTLAAKARELGVEEHAMHGDRRVRGAVLKALQDVARKEGLSGMETVAGIVLVEEEWTPANGLVTATQKVNRKAIREKYAKEIKDCIEGK
ncbi:acetyl-CoA synthetase-like protein [Parathielavia hyrcaniae]|uniref:Acetyl-CoA synthetase-like protein n=1 Tax=Parathielavia hyrcaniae TaxID=113614 RepID=A0AAN6QDN0_9PEZI|nr:acetyl-CoA synthetase-like protein [Parathielavia hyrcaniae]